MGQQHLSLAKTPSERLIALPVPRHAYFTRRQCVAKDPCSGVTCAGDPASLSYPANAQMTCKALRPDTFTRGFHLENSIRMAYRACGVTAPAFESLADIELLLGSAEKADEAHW